MFFVVNYSVTLDGLKFTDSGHLHTKAAALSSQQKGPPEPNHCAVPTNVMYQKQKNCHNCQVDVCNDPVSKTSTKW
jgi:hypothetical protein